MKKTNRDSYLKRKFNRTEAEYNRALAKQGGVCKCCGRPPGARALHVDHDHKVENWKIVSVKDMNSWKAYPEGLRGILNFMEYGKTKPEARAKVKARLKRLSCRGILCWSCNSGLKKFQDDHARLTKAGLYLWEYQNFLDGNLAETNGFGE